MSSLRLLAYVSQSTIPAAEVEHELKDIIKTAKHRNTASGITGVLFMHQGHFMQVLEGVDTEISKLMHIICQDTRHDNLHILLDHSIPVRSFTDWHMGYFNLQPHVKFDIAELTYIADEFKNNLLPHGGSFVDFYKAMLETLAPYAEGRA